MLDYRDIKKKYNSITSIEMIEAVGQNYLKNGDVLVSQLIMEWENQLIQNLGLGLDLQRL